MQATVLAGLALAITLLNSCGAPSAVASAHIAAGATSQKAPLSAIFPALLSLPGARTLTITDSWMGLHPAAPMIRHYVLERRDDRFEGEGRFTAGQDWNRNIREATRVIAVPLDVAEAFLGQLASIPVEERQYEVTYRHTDDYPFIQILADVGPGQIRFFTKAQGRHHTPWAVEFEGRTFVIDSEDASIALEMLTPYLQKEVLEDVERDALEAAREEWMRRNPTPTPPLEREP